MVEATSCKETVRSSQVNSQLPDPITCTRCWQDLQPEDFVRSHHVKSKWCNDCVTEYNRFWYQERRDAERQLRENLSFNRLMAAWPAPGAGRVGVCT